MAASSRTYRRFRRPLRGGFTPVAATAPLSLSITPSDPAAIWNNQLTQARDKEAFQNLADGHADWFVQYAGQRVKDAVADDDRTYWQGILDHTKEKIADDLIAAAVQSGQKPLEDLQSHLEANLAKVGMSSGGAPALVKQLGDVKNAIQARDFNAEMNKAQDTLRKTGDRAAYADTLSGLLARAQDPQAQAALKTQIDTIQKELTTQQANTRAADVNSKLVNYYNGKVSKAEILPYLAQMASTATSQAEADHYTTLAAQIDTRERTIAREALAQATSGSAQSLAAAIAPYSESYKAADAAMLSAFRAGSADKDAFTALQHEAQDALGALRSVVDKAPTITARKTITDQINAITTNMAERTKQMSIAITNDVKASVADWQDKAKNAPSDDLASQYRYMAAQEVKAALQDPLLTGQDQRQQVNKLLTSVADAQHAAIRAQADIVAGVKGDKFTPAAQRAYDAYVVAANDAKVDPALILSQQEFSQAGLLGAFDAGVDQSTVGKLLGAMHLPAADYNKVVGWINSLGNARDAQGEATAAAREKLNTLVAPRGDDGQIIPDTSLATGDINSAETQFVRQTAGVNARYRDQFGNVIGGTTRNAQGAEVMGPANSLDPKYGIIDEQPDPRGVAADAGGAPGGSAPGGFDLGSWLRNAFKSPIGQAVQQGLDSWSGGTMQPKPNLSFAGDSEGDPEQAAYAWLDRPANVDLQNYEIPPLPEQPAFMSQPDAALMAEAPNVRPPQGMIDAPMAA